MGKSQVRYSQEVADAICDRLAEGLSLRMVCEPDDMPDRKTVTRWLEDHPEFATKYARARDIGLDDRADALREEIELEPDVARARLLLDYGKWYLSKLAPKKYGDKTLIGSDPDNPLPTGMSDDIRAALDAIAGKVAGGDGEGKVASDS